MTANSLHYLLCIISALGITLCSKAQLVVTQNNNALQLAQSLAGPGITITNATLSSPDPSMTATFTATGTNLGMNAGIILCTGPASEAVGPNATGSTGQSMGGSGLSQLDNIAGATTYDAVKLSFDFIPLSSTVSFKYVMGSEEWLEYVNSTFNDAFAFYISGPGIAGQANLAVVPGTSTPITINTINNSSNSGYYNNNANGATIEFDGLTTLMTATNTAGVNVTPCMTYHLDLMIADGGDGVWDSGVFLEQGSLTSGQITVSTSATPSGGGTSSLPDSVSWEGCNNATITFTLNQTSASPTTVNYTIAGTATNGVDYQTLPPSVTIPAGQLSTTVMLVPISDGLLEGVETVLLNVGTSTCSTSVSTLYINDVAPPVIVVSNDTTFCIGGGDITLYAQASGSSGFFTYNWGAAAPSNYVANNLTVNPSSTTIYTVTATDPFCTANSVSDQITVNVNPLPIANAGLDMEYCAGNPLTLNASGGTLYQWYTVAGSNPIGTNINPITVSPVGTVQYGVLVSNGNCFDADTIEVAELPAAVADAGTNSWICPGGNTTLTGAGGTSYLWWQGSTLSSINTATTIASPLDTTTYYLQITDANGCVDTDSVTVFVWTLPIIDAGSDQSVCFGTIANIQASGASTYVWSPGNGLSSTNIPNPVFDSTATETYTVTGTDINGCVNNDIVTIQVVPLPIADFTIPTEICISETFTATFTGTGSSLATATWNFGSLVQIGGTNLGPVDITSVQSGSQDITLIIQEGNCVSLPDTESILINPLPLSSAGVDIAFCSGQTGVLGTTSTSGYSYNWTSSTGLSSTTVSNPDVTLTNSSSNNQTSQYIVTTTANGCSTSDTVNVLVYPIPVALFSPPSGECFVGNSFDFEANGIYDTGATFAWLFGLNGSPSTSSDSLPLDISFLVDGSQVVSLTISVNGCISSTYTDTVQVFEMPHADFVVVDNEGCTPFLGQFRDQSTSLDSIFSYSWDFYEQEGATTAQQNPDYTYTIPGTYDVFLLVETANGCKDSILKQQFITVRPLPIAGFNFSDNPVDVLNPGVYIYNSSSNAVSCSFTMPDYSTKDSCEFAVSYPDSGVYCFLQLVSNEYGCTDSTSKCLFVDPAFSFYVPNSFTPNHKDGNEVFTPKGIGVAEYELRIYNRWGQQVFRSKSLDNGWDGTVDGKEATLDVYAYEIDVIDFDKVFHHYIGKVILSR